MNLIEIVISFVVFVLDIAPNLHVNFDTHLKKRKHAQNLLKILYSNRSTIQVQSKVLITALIIFILFIARGIKGHF